METQIKKSVEINASSEKVWNVLILDEYNREWYSAFSEGTHAETDWKVGSKVVFFDKSKDGMIGKIIENEPGKSLVIEYDGVIMQGLEDYDSEVAKKVKGGQESYILTDVDGATNLAISSDMDPEYYEMMSEQWDVALEKIKTLAEQQ